MMRPGASRWSLTQFTRTTRSATLTPQAPLGIYCRTEALGNPHTALCQFLKQAESIKKPVARFVTGLFSVLVRYQRIAAASASF